MTALTLPDIAAQANHTFLPLDWVGMCNIAVPVLFDGSTLPATADAGVSLDDGAARGIHMSRLYVALDVFEDQTLTPSLLRRVLDGFLQSHTGLSAAAFLALRFELMLKRPAAISPLAGWKAYPVTLNAQLKDEVFHVELNVELDYSSTCPCSAALARQLIQQQFLADFSERTLNHEDLLTWLGSAQGVVATPHSQRSTAKLQVRLNNDIDALPIKALIDQAEAVLGTAVQTAVKRADEQAFALANGQNLMFCEDAARRLHQALRSMSWLSGFALRVEHAESLHAHDAVAHSQWHW
ncbi:GTP cyclohydrolase I FolE2 [Pseudomonas sp. P66]|jgi:GTP cyclohydrolase I|uniref:GTP cyclohydrolase FolE2 n=1 Tax=Pseudomonas arcuscaelestis TaxID=2710591 RepID=A0ABS2BS04_9PSED|nr:GTP cyclohydrolase FolE2 [Pseudomonas arcuscaelestis]MBM3110037.1 GTP cyclohydrolase I FolE2 [Pseudomonas arcuscaelestis]MBM5456235.1 GTP cyclohydrolase I FolE2 [Pseudomonas arcuscaelestis]